MHTRENILLVRISAWLRGYPIKVSFYLSERPLRLLSLSHLRERRYHFALRDSPQFENVASLPTPPRKKEGEERN
jgi:hypothetical protein